MENKLKNVGMKVLDATKQKVVKTICNPVNEIVDQNIIELSTTIGSFIVRSVRGKFQRSITFVTGRTYADRWMEEALYGILYQYNNIKGSSRLELKNPKGYNDGSGLHYELDDGIHNLKYRDFKIMLAIRSIAPDSSTRGLSFQKEYTIITYDLRPEFVTLFERDMILNRNAILKIKKDAPTINIFQDYHEGDGYTYWEKSGIINKRKINTIYLPIELKNKIISTVNSFFGSKEYYKKHGIAHNLKILLYGPPGTGKDSIARMIASEWNRNIYYITGGKEGRFIPNAITSTEEDVNYPLFLISDIDKYPFLINEPTIDENTDSDKEAKMKYKQLFGAMINALDGILSGEDRIIVMTTNHIEKFSKTFLRPGRVDLCLEIGYITPEVFRQYVYDFYHKILPKDIKLVSDKISIANLQFDVVHMKLTADEFVDKYVKKDGKESKKESA